MRSVSEARAVRKMIGVCDNLRIVTDTFADIETIGIGKHDVEQNQIRADAAAEIQGTTAGLRARKSEALFFEVILQQRV